MGFSLSLIVRFLLNFSLSFINYVFHILLLTFTEKSTRVIFRQNIPEKIEIIEFRFMCLNNQPSM